MANKLAVIGFDAQLDGLENVDQVAAAFYKGEVYHAQSKLAQTYSHAQLCRLSASRVLQANQLTGQQVAVICIGELLQLEVSDYFSCEPVASLVEALTLCALLINKKNIAVLIITADLQAAVAQQSATFSFAQDFSGYGQNSGVASLLLSSEHFAAVQHSYIYGYINAFAASSDLTKIEQTINQSFADCGLTSAVISSVEVSALAERQYQALEQSALLAAYKNGLTLHCAVSCAKSVFGENKALSELLGFLNVLFALQQRYRSAVNDWSGPHCAQLQAWLDSPFYLLNDSAPAFADNKAVPRYCAYSCLSGSGYGHIILQENNDQQVHRNGFNASSPLSLFIICGDTQSALKVQLQKLNSATATPMLKALAQQYYQHYRHHGETKYRIVLLAESAAQLQAEIALALPGIANALSRQQDWKTPTGSYFCVNPSAKHKISFLYPGIGATYLGVGRDLLHLFPQIYPSVQALSEDLAESLKDRLLMPRSVQRLDFNALKQRDLLLRSELSNIAECGVGYACLFTKIFTELFNIKADFAAGYSMGEVSMFAALGCWENPGQMSARLANSSTFTEQLSGELKVLRSLWRLAATDQDGGKLLWESYNIKGSLEQVQSAIQENERVYITLINTPDSLVIAGYPDDCQAVAKRLAVRAIALNVHNAIHCAPAYQQYEAMVGLYTMELAARISTQLYSSSCYLPVPFNKKAIAVSLAKCLCEPVDFPRLVNCLVAQGSSLFIEMGAGSALTTWTDKILAGSSAAQHCKTVAINGKGSEQQLMMARALAKLVSCGVNADLQAWFYGSIIQPIQK